MNDFQTKIEELAKKFNNLKYAKAIKISLIVLAVFIAMTIVFSIFVDLRLHKACKKLDFQIDLFAKNNDIYDIKGLNIVLKKEYKDQFEKEYKEKHGVRSAFSTPFFILAIILVILLAIPSILYFIVALIVYSIVNNITNFIRGAEATKNLLWDFNSTEKKNACNKKEKSKLQKIRNKIADVIIYTVIAILVLPLVPLLLPVFLAAIFNLKAIKKFVNIFILTNERRNDLIDAYLTLGFSTFEDTQTKKSSDCATVDIKSIIDTNYKILALAMHPDKNKAEKEKYTEIFKRIGNSRKIIEDNAGELEIKFTKDQFDERKKEFDALEENKEKLDDSLNIFESAIKEKVADKKKKAEELPNEQKKAKELNNRFFARAKKFVSGVMSRFSGDKNSQKKDAESPPNQPTSEAKSRIDSLNEVNSLIYKPGQDIILPVSNVFKTILREMKKDNQDDMELQKFSVDQAGDNDVICYNNGILKSPQKNFLFNKIEEKIKKEFSTNPNGNMNIDTKPNFKYRYEA